MVYIELTMTTGKKVLVNLSQAQAILPCFKKGDGANSHITGINNNGGIRFIETYEEIKEILKKVVGTTIV
tara:strand:+ start:1418 stop:1627 length:210 start_codon:yes stop_codon:yes gene_type:complete